MVNDKIITIAISALLIVAGVGAAIFFFLNDDRVDGVIGVDIDFVGRDIEIADDLDNGIVAIGQDSFRWMTYFGLADKCVMIDTNDRTNFMGKSFMYVGRALADVSETDDNDYTHANCGITIKDVRHIFNIDPSVVVIPENFYAEYPNEYRSLVDYGLNVVSIGHIYTFLEPGTFKIVERLDMQINLLQKVFSNVLDKDRGQELRNGINDIVADILSISSTITEKRSGYIGALAYNGAHGADSSISYYMPFALAGIENIMDDGNHSFSDSGVKTYSAATIKGKMKDDTILFLDATGIYMCDDNTSKGIIQLFKENEAYVACPYIWTGMNYENVLISAYQILRDAYELFSDQEFEAKINNVFELFLGSHESNRDIVINEFPVPSNGTTVYEDMNKLYEFRRGNPIYGKIMIGEDGIVPFKSKK